MNAQSKYGNATLQELEHSDWGEPTYASHRVTECHRLHRVQLRLLTVENLRILIGQNIGLLYLIPMALATLEQDPLAEGDFYPGDLLCAVLRVEPEFWEAHIAQREQLKRIAERARTLATSEGKGVIRALEEALAVFSGTSGSPRAG